jgi:hypothetical protein
VAIPQHARRIPPGTTDPTVVHRPFLRFWRQRTDLNEAIKALDFGHRLALHDLSLRPQLESRRLTEIYPSGIVPHNFDVSLKRASSLLGSSEEVLTEAAFLLAQPAYEYYLDAFIEFLARGSGSPKTTARSLALRHRWVKQHGVPVEATPEFELFDLLRLSRNAFIHNGGLIDAELAEARGKLSAAAGALWTRATKEGLPAMAEDQRLELGGRAPIGTIYVVGEMGVRLNRELLKSGVIKDQKWAELIVSDYRSDLQAEEKWRRSHNHQRLEFITKYAQVFFGVALQRVVESPSRLQKAVQLAPPPLNY